MSLPEIFLTAVSLSLDAVAVSVAAAVLHRLTFRQAVKIAAFFGGFQFLMPIIGWLTGFSIKGYLLDYGRYVGFLILLFLAVKMAKEAYEKPTITEVKQEKHITNNKILLLLAISTSIDALVVGFTFQFLSVNVWLASVAIGVVTFIMCIIGIFVGGKTKKLAGNRIEYLGAAILLILAFKILIF